MRTFPPTRAFPAALLLGCTLILLAGCSGDKLTRTFGLTRDAPDEYTVTTRAPLSMPPDYNLRPPRPGAPVRRSKASGSRRRRRWCPRWRWAAPPAPPAPGRQP